MIEFSKNIKNIKELIRNEINQYLTYDDFVSSLLNPKTPGRTSFKSQIQVMHLKVQWFHIFFHLFILFYLALHQLLDHLSAIRAAKFTLRIDLIYESMQRYFHYRPQHILFFLILNHIFLIIALNINSN